jgi:serine protease Do
MNKNRKKRNLIIIVAVVFCAAALGFGLATSEYFVNAFKNGANRSRQNSRPAPTGQAVLLPTGSATTVSTTDVSTLAGNIMPAMVSIECTVVNTTTDFFGRTYEQEGRAAGSGIIISQNGDRLYIVTNEHVIHGAKSTVVYFTDGSSAEAALKGSDVNADLAVIYIDLTKLSDKTKSYIRVATLGDSTQLKAGDFVVAVGNALGTGQSVTVGYVSATKREVTIDDITRVLLQTDAAINPGNSGGALINQNGEVVGVNSAKYASEEVEGTGFAIPISDAIPIITELMNREKIAEKDAGFLGIQGRTVTKSDSLQYGIPVGVYVSSVKSGSPADKAGLVVGDVIISYNGIALSTNDDLQTHLDSTRAGTEVTLVVSSLDHSKYVERTVTVTLEKR